MMDIEAFIAKHVTKRAESLFEKDIHDHEDELSVKIGGHSFLVIGGAGSIGSSFVKAILPYHPASLVIVDVNENALTELTRDIRSTKEFKVPDDYITYPMDYSSDVFEKMFRFRKGFDYVANFSAHKHVRSEKDIYSVETLLRNNVIYARRLLELMKDYPPQTYFCVSTDKAANPVNIMGASKRIMEDVIFAYSNEFPVKTARFANVAFSNGSLPAGFLSRIQKLQPLSAPNDVKRYFVSPKESGQICMLACILGNNQEIFFPKLEEAQMMSFDRIAELLLEELGYQVLHCNSDDEAIQASEKLREGIKEYPVHFSVSDTSGEKSYEEFFVPGEAVDLERFMALGVITGKERSNLNRVIELFNNLNAVFDSSDCSKEAVVKVLETYLPEFHHIEKGKSLDSKM